MGSDFTAAGIEIQKDFVGFLIAISERMLEYGMHEQKHLVDL